jgi:hypothetical protein
MRRFLSVFNRVALTTLAAFSLAGIVSAQGANSTLNGIVTDQNGAGREGVLVTATSSDTGLSRKTHSARDGAYSLPSLPPGTYTVRFEQQGFKTVEQKNVVLNVASTRTLSVTMNVSAVAEIVTVSNEAPILRSEPAMGAVISQKELQTLPLNGRQFANVAVLAPGTQLSYNSDPTKPGQLTVQLNGGSGRNVNYIIDGGDNTDDTIGGALQNFSLESVQEFKIQTQQYKAEYGRSSGGVLNVVTKTGTNSFHGGAFEYFRDKKLNAETETEKIGGSGKADYRRHQYGASLGGPIVPDKVHFFATGEKLEQPAKYTVNTGGVYPNLDGTSVATPFKDDLIAAKVTADISASQFLQVRFGYQKNSQKYGASPNHTPDNLGTLNNKYTSILVGHQASLGPLALNEFIFQYTDFKNSISPDSTNPTIYFAGGIVSGQSPASPQATFQKKYHFKDDVSYAMDLGGSHEFKFGVSFVHEPTLGGDGSFPGAPQYTLNGKTLDSSVASYTATGGFNGYSVPTNQYDIYLQDDFRPTSRLTVNAGIRYDLNLGFDLNQSSNPIYQELAASPYNDAFYYRNFHGWDGKLKNDHKNWAPRIGFSWDATGEGKTFVHGGWGIYYDFPYINATLLFPAGAVQSNFGRVYQVSEACPGCGIQNPDGSLFHIGDPLPPNELPSADIPPVSEVADKSVTKTPFSRQLSIGVSHQVNDWLAVSLDYSHINYRDLPYRMEFNLKDQPGGARRFPDLSGTDRIWLGGGYADYNGGNLGFNARLSDKLRLQGFYTLSKITGNILGGADEFRLTSGLFQPDLGSGGYGGRKDVSINPLDPNCHDICSGPIFTDARHKITLGATYTGPFGMNFSGVFRYRSAQPVLVFDGRDLNHDGYNVDLAPGRKLDDGLGHSFEQTDLSVSKDFMIGGGVGIELIAQLFNVFNAKNPNGYHGRQNDASGVPLATFGQPSKYAGDALQGEQRLLQLAARVHF